jgi:hypothetical protein
MGRLTVSGVSRVFVSPSQGVSRCLVIRFLSGGRLDDENYAISGVFCQFAFPNDPVSWLAPYRISKAGSPPSPVRGQNFTRS